MSIFKEKDDLLTKAFQNLDDEDSDDYSDTERETESKHRHEDSLLNESPTIKKLKLDPKNSIEEEDEKQKDNSPPEPTESQHECINLDSGDSSSFQDSSEIVISSSNDNDDCDETTDCEDAEDEQNDSSNVITENNNNNISSLNQSGLNISQDYDDRQYKIRFRHFGNYSTVATTYKTKLSVAFGDVLNKLQAKGRTLVFGKTPKGQKITFDDSPYSLGLAPGDILDAIEIAIDAEYTPQATKTNVTHTTDDPNSLKATLQDGNRKNTKELRIMKDQRFLELKENYAKLVNVDADRISFSFDGELIDDDSTPNDLDIDDEFVIDVVVAK